MHAELIPPHIHQPVAFFRSRFGDVHVNIKLSLLCCATRMVLRHGVKVDSMGRTRQAMVEEVVVIWETGWVVMKRGAEEGSLGR